MINLHERLSEFSYGFGVTREVQSLLEGIGLRPTPFMLNLLHEKEFGFDVGFEDRGRVVVLQFKLATSSSAFIGRRRRSQYRFCNTRSGDLSSTRRGTSFSV